MASINDYTANQDRSLIKENFTRCTNWNTILTPHGWRISEINKHVVFWQAPGQRAAARSAMSGCEDDDLHVFYGDGCHPLIRGMTYSKWEAHCVLNFDCDEQIAEDQFKLCLLS
jgi:hypothetical protein